MTSVANTWRDWRAAEGLIGRGAEFEVAVGMLPPRQGALLRALAALELGDRAGIAAAAEASEHADIRAVLQLALAKPEGIDPVGTRAAAKEAGVTNAPLPRLDLVRRLACTLGGDVAQTPQALSHAGRMRPVLRATIDALQSRRYGHRTLAWLELRSPRLRALWSVAIAAQFGEVGPVRQLAGRTTLEFDIDDGCLEPERWPKIAREAPAPRRAEPKPRKAPKDPLDEFLRAPRAKGWSRACEVRLEALARGPRPERRLALGRLLIAVHALVTGPEPWRALAVVQATAQLAQTFEQRGPNALLIIQLSHIAARITWWRAGERAEALEALVAMTAHLPLEERQAIAAELLEVARPGVSPPEVASDLLRLHIECPAACTDKGLRLVQQHAALLTRARLDAALREKDPVRRALFSAAYELGRDAPHDALAEVCDGWRQMPQDAPTVERRALGELAEAWFALAVDELADARTPRAAARRRAREAVAKLAEALVAGRLDARLEHYAQLVFALELLEHGQPKSDHAPLRAHLRARLAAPCASQAEELAPERFALLRFALDGAAADERFRALGRWLREGEPVRTVPFALRWSATIESYDDDSNPQVARWLRAVAAWLAQRPADEVGRHALALGKGNEAMASRLIEWSGLHLPEGHWTEEWDELMFEAEDSGSLDPDDLGSMFDLELGSMFNLDVVEEIAERLGPGGFRDLLEQVGGMEGLARLAEAGFSPPGPRRGGRHSRDH